MEAIKYRAGYKYQLCEDYRVQTPIIPERDIVTPYLCLTNTGVLSIREGYAWDGASGPTFDTANSMRGSLIHDALYALMRECHLEYRQWRDPVDRLLQKVCVEDGMWRIRAWTWYWGVRLGAGPCVLPSSNKPIMQAP